MRSLYIIATIFALIAPIPEGTPVSNTNATSSTYRRIAPSILGTKNPEDLVQLPGTKWVIVSSMRTADGMPGHLYAVDAEKLGAPVEVYPTKQPAVALDLSNAEPDCVPPDPKLFFPHGISTVRLLDGSFRLLVVNHGGRESVEVFRITLHDDLPKAVWTGCISLPPRSFGNGVAPLPDGGFIVSNMYDPTDPDYLDKFARGQITGEVLRWSKAKSWTRAVGQPFSGANGVETSHDGNWLFVSEWSARKLWKFPLHGVEGATSVQLTFLPDNLRWTDHGTLLLAGQRAPAEEVFGCEARDIVCPMGFEVVEVNPTDLSVHLLLREGDNEFGGATGAAFIKDELWVGSYRGNQIARYLPTHRERTLP